MLARATKSVVVKVETKEEDFTVDTEESSSDVEDNEGEVEVFEPVLRNDVKWNAASFKAREKQRKSPRSRIPMNIPCCGGFENTGTTTCDESMAGLTTVRCDCPIPPSRNYAVLSFVLKAIDATWASNADWSVKVQSNQNLVPASTYWPIATAKVNVMLTESAISYQLSAQTLKNYTQMLLNIEQPKASERLHSTSFFECLRGLQSKVLPGLEAVQTKKASVTKRSALDSSSSLVQASGSGLLVDPATVTVGNEGTSSGSASPVVRPAKKPRIAEANLATQSMQTFNLDKRLKMVDQEIATYEAEGNTSLVTSLRAARSKLVLQLCEI